MNHIQKIREEDFRCSYKPHVNDFSNLRVDVISQINYNEWSPQYKNPSALFVQPEESALNLSRRRNEPPVHFTNHCYHTPTNPCHHVTRLPINLVNLHETIYPEEYYGTSSSDLSELHLPSAFSIRSKHAQMGLNVAASNPNLLDESNFQDVCVLFDVLLQKIKWNIGHLLDSVNVPDDYWRQEGHFKFKVCLTDIINATNEIKGLNTTYRPYLGGAPSRKARLLFAELTQELEAFIRSSRKMLVTESTQFKNDYVRYCENFSNDLLSVYPLKHKKPATFERVLTENHHKISLIGTRQDEVKNTNAEEVMKKVESATQTSTDTPNENKAQRNITDAGAKRIESATQTFTKNSTDELEVQAKIKTNGMTVIRSKDLIISPHTTIKGKADCITITQCPKTPSPQLGNICALKTQSTNSFRRMHAIKMPKPIRKNEERISAYSKHKIPDIIITPAYSTRAPFKIHRLKRNHTASVKDQVPQKKKKNLSDEDVIIIEDSEPKHFDLINTKHKIGNKSRNLALMKQIVKVTGISKNPEGNVAIKERLIKFKQDGQTKKIDTQSTISNGLELRVHNGLMKTSGSNMQIKRDAGEVNRVQEQKNIMQKDHVKTSILKLINKNSARGKSPKQHITERLNAPPSKTHANKSTGGKYINMKHAHNNPEKRRDSFEVAIDDNVNAKDSQITIELDSGCGSDEDDKEKVPPSKGGMGFVHQIAGLEVKHHLTPEEYVDEVKAVDKMDIPTVFKCFYTYVTKQQILQRVNPISFKLFLELFNNGGLRNFYKKYIDYQKRHDV